MNFGNILKALRLEHGLTQAELAAKLSLGESTISHYELGSREPDNETLLKIADLFDISMDVLFGREYKGQRELLGVNETSAIYDKSKSSKLHRKIDQLPEEKQKVIETITDSFLREVKPPDNNEQAAVGAGK